MDKLVETLLSENQHNYMYELYVEIEEIEKKYNPTSNSPENES